MSRTGFKAKVEFWTVWSSLDTVCSKHQTLKAAVRAVKECERRGGAHHRILCVQEFLRGEGEK